MSFGGSKTPKKVPKPAERQIDVEPEDIQIGDDSMEISKLNKGGKRSLIKPAGGTNSTGLNI